MSFDHTGREATVRDVARLARVSTATVSRVLSASATSRVRDETRLRVEEAAAQLAYEPSSLPLYMRRRRSRVVGIVLSDVENPFFTAVVRSAEDSASSRGYRLVLLDTGEEVENEITALNTLAAERVAGVILAPIGRPHRELLRLVKLGLPVVAFDNKVPGLVLDEVMVNNREASREAVQHLLGLGHHRIAMIRGPQRASSIQDRFLGYKDAMRESGVADLAGLVAESDLREGRAELVALALLRRRPRPTALFCVNNMTTIGAMRAIRRLGISVPNELSVVGFDDFPLADILSPALTVVRQPTQSIGGEAVRMLLDHLEMQGSRPRSTVLRTDLVIRDSTAPPAEPQQGGTESRSAQDQRQSI